MKIKVFGFGNNHFNQITGKGHEESTALVEVPRILKCDLKSTEIVKVVIGWSNISCLTGDGHFQCLGYPAFGTPTDTDTEDIAVSWTDLFVLSRQGELFAYSGSNPPTSISLASEARGLHVDSGVIHTVVLSETGELINIEKEDSGYIPRLLDFKHKVTNVSCGKEHVLLTAQGNIYSYGYGSRGQLGHGDTEKQREPCLVEALDGVTMVTVASGGWHSAAISSIGDLYIWGWNERGQLGLPCKNLQKINMVNKKHSTKSGVTTATGLSLGRGEQIASHQEDEDHKAPPIGDTGNNVSATYPRNRSPLNEPDTGTPSCGGDHLLSGPPGGNLTEPFYGSMLGQDKGLAETSTKENKNQLLQDIDNNSFRGESNVLSKESALLASADTKIGGVVPSGENISYYTETFAGDNDSSESAYAKHHSSGETPSDIEALKQSPAVQTILSMSAESPVIENDDDVVCIGIQSLPALLDFPGEEEVTVSKVSCGSQHTAVVTDEGDLYTWGWNAYGQLGHGDTVTRDVATRVQHFDSGGLTVTDVFCGYWNTVVTVSE